MAHLRANRFSERDIQGMLAYEDMFDRLRLALRTGPEGDTWQGDSPTREQLAKRLGHDPELIPVLFEESIADTLDRYVDDQRMKDALYGQGVIGAWAGPRDPGTASIKLMHYQGDLLGQGPLWGFVEGAWARSPSPSPRPPATWGRPWPPGCRWPRSSPARGCGWRVAS